MSHEDTGLVDGADRGRGRHHELHQWGRPRHVPDGRSAPVDQHLTSGLHGQPRSAPATTAPAPIAPATKTIATGLPLPWGLAFLPDGTALVTLRDQGEVLHIADGAKPVSYTHLRAHETGRNLVCRLL